MPAVTGSRVTFRAATAADQPAIKALVRAAGINPLGLDWRRFTVALDNNGELIGCGQIKPHADGSRELASIAVTPAWQKQGLGRALIEHLMETAVPPLWLTCHSRLIPFYQKFGYREVTAGEALPAYFDRLRRFSGLTRLFIRGPGYLAIMVWGIDQQS